MDANPNATVKGALKISATFTGWYQQLPVELPTPNLPKDLTGQVLEARVMLVRGLSAQANAPGGGRIYVKTGTDYVWGNGPWTNLSQANQWTSFSIDMLNPEVYSGVFDSTSVVAIGVELSSGGGGSPQAAFGSALDTVVYIDYIVSCTL